VQDVILLVDQSNSQSNIIHPLVFSFKLLCDWLMSHDPIKLREKHSNFVSLQ